MSALCFQNRYSIIWKYFNFNSYKCAQLCHINYNIFSGILRLLSTTLLLFLFLLERHHNIILFTGNRGPARTHNIIHMAECDASIILSDLRSRWSTRDSRTLRVVVARPVLSNRPSRGFCAVYVCVYVSVRVYQWRIQEENYNERELRFCFYFIILV